MNNFSWLPSPAAWPLALGVACLVLGTLGAPAAESPDSKALEGAWKPVKAELGGQPMDEAILKSIQLKLHDGRYEVVVAGRPDQGTYTIDDAAKPKGMAITGTEGPNKGRTFPAIYELEGATLRICYDLSGRKRPEAFKTAAGTQLYLVTYQRAGE